MWRDANAQAHARADAARVQAGGPVGARNPPAAVAAAAADQLPVAALPADRADDPPLAVARARVPGASDNQDTDGMDVDREGGGGQMDPGSDDGDISGEESSGSSSEGRAGVAAAAIVAASATRVGTSARGALKNDDSSVEDGGELEEAE